MVQIYNYIRTVAAGWSFVVPTSMLKNNLVPHVKYKNTCATDTFLMTMVFLTAQGRFSSTLIQQDDSAVFDCVLKVDHTVDGGIVE